MRPTFQEVVADLRIMYDRYADERTGSSCNRANSIGSDARLSSLVAAGSPSKAGLASSAAGPVRSMSPPQQLTPPPELPAPIQLPAQLPANQPDDSIPAGAA